MVEEQMSIRDLRAILEALATVAPTEKDPLNLTEFVRGQPPPRDHLPAHRRAPRTLSLPARLGNIEEAIRHAITRTAAGSFLTLAPRPRKTTWLAAYAAPWRKCRATLSRIVILTQPDIRRFVRKLVEIDSPT